MMLLAVITIKGAPYRLPACQGDRCRWFGKSGRHRGETFNLTLVGRASAAITIHNNINLATSSATPITNLWATALLGIGATCA